MGGLGTIGWGIVLAFTMVMLEPLVNGFIDGVIEAYKDEKSKEKNGKREKG